MKVMREVKWNKCIHCCACESYLRIETGDLRMDREESPYIVCLICETKNTVDEVPDYIVLKLKKLLEQKTS